MADHWRKCWDCGNTAIHSDSVVPAVLCKECGSQDTRRLKDVPVETNAARVIQLQGIKKNYASEMYDLLVKAIDVLDPEMRRHEIVQLREECLRLTHKIIN